MSKPERDRSNAELKPWFAPLLKAREAAAFLLAHALLSALMLILMAVLRALATAIGDPLLFGVVPIAGLLDLGDAMIILCFVGYGCLEAIRIFRESKDDG